MGARRYQFVFQRPGRQSAGVRHSRRLAELLTLRIPALNMHGMAFEEHQTQFESEILRSTIEQRALSMERAFVG